MEIRWPIGKSVLQKLSRKKYRREFKLYFIEGITTVNDAIEAGAPVVGLYFDERLVEKDRNLLSRAAENNIPTEEMETAEIGKYSDLVTPPPVLAVVRISDENQPSIPFKGKLILALDRVSDPGNLGTLIRSSVFFGIKEIWLGSGCVEVYNPKVIRSAMTAHFGIKLCENVDLVGKCNTAKENGVKILAASMKGIDKNYPELTEEKSGVLILGNEPNGISESLLEIVDKELTVLKQGPVESLNVAMAGTVMIDRLLHRKV